MTDEAAIIVWLALAGWLALGLVIGLGVILFGLKRLTPAASHMPLRVWLLILPGLAALWPVVLLRLSGVRAPEDKA